MSRPRSRGAVLLVLPLIGWLTWFLVVPLAYVALYSLWRRGAYGNVIQTLNLDNYRRAFDPLYTGIFLQSLGLALLTTVVCALIGYPVAYAIATAPPRRRALLFVWLMVPFLTNFVVRVYAIRLLLGPEGPLNALLAVFSLGPLLLTDTPFSVAFGMITNYLPFMVLPIYVVLEKLDFNLVEAAHDLGASGPAMVWRVLLPLSRAGLVSGAVLVFVPVLGEFMIPDLLGGARTMLLGNLITEQFLKARDWPFGAALAVLLIAVMAGGFALQAWLSRKDPAREALRGGL